MSQKNPQCTIKPVFTQEQIEEQEKFIADLENGTADIVFEGSRLEVKAYLDGIGQLVDHRLH